jgi:hypothetical protein
MSEGGTINMKAQEIRRNMKRDFIWILAVLMLIGLLGLASISLAIEDTCTTKADMSIARTFPSTSTVNGKIYVIGGSFAAFPWAPVSTVEEYDTGFVPSIISADSSIMSVDATGKLTTTWGKIKRR